MKKILFLTLAAALLLGGCGGEQPVDPTPTLAPTPGVSAQPTPTPEVTPEATPTPQVTVQPTPTPQATAQPTPVVTPTPQTTTQPETTYFDDAVFIGDSRTEGLRLYSGISTTFLSYVGQTIFTVRDEKTVETTTNGTTSIYQALQAKQYGKVFICLGINEIARDPEDYEEAYRQVLDRIKQLQPDAVIYLVNLAPVNEELARSKGYAAAVNNANIGRFNGVIQEIAEDYEANHVDVFGHFVNDAGSLSADLCWDGIHLNVAANKDFYEFLKTQVPG